MDWSPQQDRALKAVSSWLRDPGRAPVFRLFGFAGTGKTTLARHFAEGVDGSVLFAAYTGKAALCLQRAGCRRASTIHQLIYKPREKSRKRLGDWEKELDELVKDGVPLDDPRVINLRRKIEAEKKKLKQPAFELNLESELLGASLLVVDEVSMVDQRMANDLLSFKVPILALGDPFQLPPVRGTGYFTHGTEEEPATPDVMLTEIHRQAKGDPIIDIATHIREKGRPPVAGVYGESRVIHRHAFYPDDIPPDVQVIVGRNKTRKRGNARRRRALGFGEDYMPQLNDRLICLRNDHQEGLLNGAIYNVVELGDVGQFLEMTVSDDDTDRLIDVRAHIDTFRGNEVPYYIRREAQEFDYGYVITGHKSQGSQWEKTLVIDESSCFRKDAANWLYTAVTRATRLLTLVLW